MTAIESHEKLQDATYNIEKEMSILFQVSHRIKT